MRLFKLKLLILVFVCLSIPVQAASTNGYVRKNGTYVAPYQHTSPNRTNRDNYSTRGNSNPFTGQQGHRARDYSPQAQNYGQGRSVNTGPRGGQSYTNSKGNKVYVPKR